MERSYNYQIDCHDDNLVDIMKRFTEVDLNTNLITTDVFAFFSDDIIFVWYDHQVGKTIGWLFFKICCEYNLVSINSDPDVSIIDKAEYIIWKFSCVQ